MDLIYMDASKADLGVIQDYTLDLAFGTDENDFECKIIKANHCCEAGYYLYFEGTEYGGTIDSITVDSANEEVTYSGRSWHGILNTKILEPDAGEDYLVLNGEANAVLGTLLSRMGLTDLFVASSEVSDINIYNYQIDRYIKGYDGIRKMLKAEGAKLDIAIKEGFVELSAKPIIDYSKDEQFDTDQIDFVVTKNSSPINHVICLGKGDLAEREVIHIYADSNGNISDTQSLTGILEVSVVYDYSNAENTEELRKGGVELIQESWNSNEIDFGFNANDETYDIGDIVGAREAVTGVEVNAEITKKIISIANNTTTISYKVGE